MDVHNLAEYCRVAGLRLRDELPEESGSDGGVEHLELVGGRSGAAVAAVLVGAAPAQRVDGQGHAGADGRAPRAGSHADGGDLLRT